MIRNLLILFLLIISTGSYVEAAEALIDFNFQSTTLPDGITTDGTISTTGAIGNCTECSIGRLNIALSGFFQVDVPSCSVLNLKMKSSASGARNVTLKYKLEGETDFTTLGVLSVVGAVDGIYLFQLATDYPQLVSSGPISIRLENAASGGQFHIHDIYAEGNSALSTEAEIVSFKIPSQVGDEVINSGDGTIAIAVPSGTILSSITPSAIELSAHASINPLPTTPQDFSAENEITYTVTAQDGVTAKDWKVKVFEITSSEKEILTFILTNNQIGESAINSEAGTIIVVMPNTEDLTNLIPESITISDAASIEPNVDVARNFSTSIIYTVTAQDASTKEWTVTVQQIDLGATYYDYQAENALFTGKIDNQHSNYTGTGFIDFLSTGENYIQFTVCQQGAAVETLKFRYSLAKDDIRTGNLFVNDIFVQQVEFPRTTVFTEWFESIASVTLQAGINTIKLTWDETDGPNLDKLSVSGTPCNSYSLTITTTNGGVVNASPVRASKKYFEGETVTLLAEGKPDLLFLNWSGDASGTDNPLQFTMTGDKNITGNFTVVNTFNLTVAVNGIGEVLLDPPGGEYTEGTLVTLTPQSVLGSTFQGWGGALSGSVSPETITMNANKSVSATFTSNLAIDFDIPVGFASVNTGSTYPNFNGPTTGGSNALDTLWVNGPTDFDALAWHLYYRNRAYKNNTTENGVPKAPLVIVLKEGVYTEGVSSSSAWGNHMLTIQEQGDLTIIGQGTVTLNFGLNVKRSWNIIIQNIMFQDYYDDGINIGEPETHHVWVDHCTFGHPTTLPSDSEHPDGGIDIKAGASYITISWCNYRNSWKTGLVGHSDGNGSEDTGKLKVTYFSNYFLNTNSRNPRVRFGEVHVLNNLEEGVILYGIAAANSSHVYAENNFFLNTRWAMYADRTVEDFKAVFGNNTDNVFTSKTGNIPASGLKQIGNAYDDSGLPVITAQINPAMLNPGGRSVKFDEFQPENVFDPHSYYSYTPFPASVVRTLVPIYAGAGKIDFFNSSEQTGSGEIILTGELVEFSQTLGTPSQTQTYSVSGSDLTENITIMPPAGYEISADGGSNWFNLSTPLIINQSGGIVASTIITVRLNATEAASYSGNITHSSTGITSVVIPVTGVTESGSGNGDIPEGTWTIYEADVLPNAFTPVFSASSGTFTAAENVIVTDPDIANNNLLRMDVAQNQFFWRMNFANLGVSVTNLTLVMRIKGNATKDLTMDLDMHYSDLRSRVSLFTDADSAKIRNGVGANVKLGSSSTEWNIYRFVMSATETKLFVNESTTPLLVFTPATSTSSNRHFRFGDGDSNNTFGADIDWIVWDVTGAFTPGDTKLPALTGVDSGGENPAVIVTAAFTEFTQIVGSPSDIQTYTVSGNNLTGDITITPPTDYEISPDGTAWSTKSTPLVLVQSEGSVESTTLQVRLNAPAPGEYLGSIMHSSEGVTSVELALSGSTTVPPPVISVSGTLTSFSQTVGTASAMQTYSLSGSNLLGDITVTPPVKYEVSSDAGTTWKTNSSPLVLTATNGTVAATTISVRLNSDVEGNFTGNILHQSSGVATLNLAVTGIVEPMITAIEHNFESTIIMSPNPARESITIHRSETSIQGFVYIYNTIGNKVADYSMEINQENLIIYMDSFATGLYIVEYVSKNGKMKQRLIKSN